MWGSDPSSVLAPLSKWAPPPLWRVAARHSGLSHREFHLLLLVGSPLAMEILLD
jgi:hypothetical protein